MDQFDEPNKNVAPDKLKSILRKIIMIGRLAEPVRALILTLFDTYFQANVTFGVISEFFTIIFTFYFRLTFYAVLTLAIDKELTVFRSSGWSK